LRGDSTSQLADIQVRTPNLGSTSPISRIQPTKKRMGATSDQFTRDRNSMITP
jgi:hypothetical protein